MNEGFLFTKLSFCALFILIIGCSTTKTTSISNYKSNVLASYYADKFNGRQTANGQIFNNINLTCAHRTFAFGTKLKVTNTTNNQSVAVEVNDRGPHKKDREIDLSKSAFMKITDDKNKGILVVNLQIIK